MHRVELKEMNSLLKPINLSVSFLMHRVELKDGGNFCEEIEKGKVSNAPCGVESVSFT